MSHPADLPTSQPPGSPSIGELFADVSRDLSELIRQELALAKAEATQSATRAGAGAGMHAGAALAGFFLLMFVSMAAWWTLGEAIGRGWSALIVALVWGVIGAVLASQGRARLKAVKGLPQTTETVKRIPNALTPDQENAR